MEREVRVGPLSALQLGGAGRAERGRTGGHKIRAAFAGQENGIVDHSRAAASDADAHPILVKMHRWHAAEAGHLQHHQRRAAAVNLRNEKREKSCRAMNDEAQRRALDTRYSYPAGQVSKFFISYATT